MSIGSTTIHLFRGSMRILTAESLALPCGLILLTFLTRKLGPANFGLYILAVAVVSWLEWTLNTLFSRASIKLVGEDLKRGDTAGTVLQMYTLASLAFAAILFVSAEMIAGKLGEPELAGLLRLFSIDIPLWAASHAYRSILIGRQAYRERALLSVVRWVSRTVFTISFVLISPTVGFAMTGWICSSAAEMIAGSRLVSLTGLSRISRQTVFKLLSYAAPLSLLGLILRFYDKLDLFILKWLGAEAEIAGIYAAGQDVSRGTGLLSLAFATPLLATLTRAMAEKKQMEAGRVIITTYRGTLLLIPLMAFGFSISPEFIRMFFGEEYVEAIPLMFPFLYSSFFVFLITIGNSVLTAAGRPGLAMSLTFPLLPISIAGYLLIIPEYGPVGAAYVSFAAVFSISVINAFAVYRIVKVDFPSVTLLRSVLIAALIWLVLGRWHTQGWMVAAKVVAGGAAIPLLLWISGEIKQRDVESVRQLFGITTGAQS